MRSANMCPQKGTENKAVVHLKKKKKSTSGMGKSFPLSKHVHWWVFPAWIIQQLAQYLVITCIRLLYMEW